MPLVDLGKNLLEAARLGQIEAVQILLLNGALFTTDWLGNSALHFAALNGHTEMCEVLLRAGVSRDGRTKVNRTPLHLAAQHGHLPVIMLLIDSGADVHATDMIGMSALHWAVQKGHTDTVQFLMQHGANAALPNKFYKTPLDIAVDIGRDDLLQLMQHLSGAEEEKFDLTDCDTVTHELTENDMSESALGLANDVLTTVVIDTDNDQSLHVHTTDPPSLNTAVQNVTVTVPNVITIAPQVTCQSVHTADETFPASPSVLSSKTSSADGSMTASDTLTWLKTHGTAIDNTSFVTSMLSSGQKVVLTEAGKLLMSTVKPFPDMMLTQTHEVNKNKMNPDNKEHADASYDEVEEPLSKKSKCSEDELTNKQQQQHDAQDIDNTMTDKPSSLKQQLRRPS